MQPMTGTLESTLNAHIKAFETLGHPSLMERFVVLRGEVFECRDDAGYHRGVSKECFRNAALLSLENDELTYVEGYGMLDSIPFPIHHAWCVDERGVVVDVTWDADSPRQYIGVRISKEDLRDNLLKNGVYGVLDTGVGINVDFILRKAPELGKVLDDLEIKMPRSRQSKRSSSLGL